VPASKSCSYGSECCCGKCHPSFVAQCEWISANGRRSWVGFNTDACLSPNCGNTDCPKNKPALGSPCSVPASERCSYGSECCCGKCHPSFVATCQLISGRHSWVGFNTDACLRPNCGNADCPKNAPALGSPCSVPASKSCSYGSECCCGKCHPSFIARCYLARAPNGRRTWRGSYTDACLRPNCGSTDACSQPSGITGPCKAAVPRWTFDKERGCQRFTYGGCAGNANNFYTRAECLKTCIRIIVD